MINELIVDIFAGGGGVSTGIYLATGRHPDIAINHNDDALSMHRANHPQTRHFVADVYEVCPKGATQGRSVGWMHLSPDCTHHSQAAGGQPRSKRLRSLAWVGYRWAGQVQPRVISLENVTQILKWGPLIAKRDKTTGRVIKLDGTVAAKGERVTVQQQHLVPDPKRVGQTWNRFTSALVAVGYQVQCRTLCAADYGVPTTRERLFMIARRDGQSINWPAPTHFKNPANGKNKWRSAAEIIDWAIPCPSIFKRKKPLADATLRRIAKGMDRYVLSSANPFIVPIAHYNGRDIAQSIADPLKTITAATKGGEFSLVAPILAKLRGDSAGTRMDDPVPTITSGGASARPAGSSHALAVVAPVLAHLRNHCDARNVEEPLKTITSSGQHHAVVSAFMSSYFTDDSNWCRSSLSQEEMDDIEGALWVAAFLIRYYGEGGQLGDPDQPMSTITTKDRLALVTVMFQGRKHLIVDIGLRMFQPAELYLGQGFPQTYGIEYGHDGRKFSKSTQVRLVGNSVPPGLMAALVYANYTPLADLLNQVTA